MAAPMNVICVGCRHRLFLASICVGKRSKGLSHAKNLYTATTPIFYVNAAPHIGHLYTALLADASCRWQKLNGQTVKLVTGTDEHGLKIQKAADKHGQSPVEYCHQISQKYKELFAAFNIDYTDFIRTTDERHKEAVQHFWKRISKYIFKGKYTGWYCMNDEAFLTNSQVEPASAADGIMVSRESGQPCESIEEENYMFPLHQFSDEIRRWHQQNMITPASFTSSLEGVLENVDDLSISRSKERLTWGIPVPDDPTQTVYVWLDALVNYLTACGYPHLDNSQWPVDCHIVGKDILRFHAVYWPAFLMAAELPLPKSILCHSHWLVDDRKMSKSVGNVVSPWKLADNYTADGLRYFLLREGVPSHDGNYSEKKMANYLNSELCNTLGNLLNRCTSTSINSAQVYPTFDAEVYESTADEQWRKLLDGLHCLPGVVGDHYKELNFYKGVDSIMAQLRETNLFMETMKPWKLKDNQQMLDLVLHMVMENLRVSGILLQPIVPSMANLLLTRLGVPADCRSAQHLLPAHSQARQLQPGPALYKRVQKT